MSLQEPQWDTNEQAARWDEMEVTLIGRAALRHVPIGATFELTPFCNLRCKMCYIRLDRQQADRIGRQLTAAEWISLADQTLAAGTLNLLLTGGEPLLRPDFEEIYTAITDRPFIVTLNTNGALVDEKVQALLKKRPPSSIAVTLYGASAETYGSICGDAGAFERTLRGLELLRDVPTQLEVRTTFIKDNMHEADAVRELASRYTDRFAINLSVFKPVRGATADVEACRLDPRQAMELDMAVRDYYEAKHAAGHPAEKAEKPAEQPAPARRFFGHELPPTVLECNAAKAMYWLTWDGKMLACGTFAEPYTLPLEEGFTQAWNRLPTLFDNITLPAKCTTCEYDAHGCPNCPANIQAETGGFTQPAPYLCEYAKQRYEHLSARRARAR